MSPDIPIIRNFGIFQYFICGCKLTIYILSKYLNAQILKMVLTASAAVSGAASAAGSSAAGSAGASSVASASLKIY